MLDRRPQTANILESGSWLRSRTSRLLSGLGLAALFPGTAEAARKGDRQARDEERKNDDAGGNRDEREQSNQNKRGSDQENDDKAGTEDRNSRDQSDKSGKRDRNETRSQDDDGGEQSGSDGGKSRGESRRRDADSDSSSGETSPADDVASQRSGRRVQEFEQQADEPADDTPAPTRVTPANPNVVVDDIPSSSIADLVVEANDDVVATVSTSGGFAFARSGDVIAVTGPDGATIVHTGDVATGTRGTRPGGAVRRRWKQRPRLLELVRVNQPGSFSPSFRPVSSSASSPSTSFHHPRRSRPG